MTSLSKNARVAGFRYLLLVFAGVIRLIYIPSTLFVHEDATATASDIAKHEALFRLGIAADLFGGVLLIFLALTLTACSRGWSIPKRYCWSSSGVSCRASSTSSTS